MKRVLALLFSFILVIGLFACGGSSGGDSEADSYTYQAPAATSDSLQTSSLSDVKMDESIVSSGVKKILSGSYNDVLGLLIVKDGKLVLEEYFEGYDSNTQVAVWSVSKSITATAIGIAIDRADIDSVDETVFDYFPEYSYLENSKNSQITIKHLLTMTSGFDWKTFESPYDTEVIKSESDPIRYILSKSVITTPGTVYNYSMGDVVLLGEIIKKVSNMNIKEYLDQYLFGPMGITSFNCDTIGKSSVYDTSAGMAMRPRDMAKIGLLFMQNGVWNGSQIIATEWVTEATKEQFSLTEIGLADTYAYGYLWRLNKWTVGSVTYESYFAFGYGGQRIINFSNLNMIVVFTGDDLDGDFFNSESPELIVPKYILPAIIE